MFLVVTASPCLGRRALFFTLKPKLPTTLHAKTFNSSSWCTTRCHVATVTCPWMWIWVQQVLSLCDKPFKGETYLCLKQPSEATATQEASCRISCDWRCMDVVEFYSSIPNQRPIQHSCVMLMCWVEMMLLLFIYLFWNLKKNRTGNMVVQWMLPPLQQKGCGLDSRPWTC